MASTVCTSKSFKNEHVTEKLVASVNASLAIPAYCLVILPTGSSLDPRAAISSKGKSQVQQTPLQGQHGPFILKMGSLLASLSSYHGLQADPLKLLNKFK